MKNIDLENPAMKNAIDHYGRNLHRAHLLFLLAALSFAEVVIFMCSISHLGLPKHASTMLVFVSWANVIVGCLAIAFSLMAIYYKLKSVVIMRDIKNQMINY